MSTRSALLLVTLCVAGALLALYFRFVQDDAFIAFSYARNLVEGHGLTWFGERVEGYTDFLWVLWIALGLALGIDAIAWSYVGGIASFVVVIAVTWRLCHRIFAEHTTGFIALAFLLSNYTVLSYATGGLETMAQTALLCAAMWRVYELWAAPSSRRSDLLWLSVLCGLAVLVRPDSALPCAIMGMMVLGTLIRRRSPLQDYAYLCLPVGLLLGAWGAWKLAYYGSLLPNTYHAKVAHELNANGIRYVWRFLHWYLIWPVLMLGALARLLFPSAPRFRLWPLWVVTCGWILYVVSIGGDFMEFRLFVPIAPFVFIGLAHLVHHPAKLLGHRLGTAATAAAVLLLVAASTHHARTFKGTTADDALDSIHLLSTFYGLYPDGRWDTLTNALQPLQQTDVVIGLFAVGAVPYYSRLATVDMYGLNSRDVATAGDALDRSAWRPGHRVQASLQQLHDHGVNLVIGHPRLVPLGVLNQGSAEPMCRSFIRAMMSSRTETVHDTAVVQMPVSPRVGLLMWYLTPHPRVDELVASGQWSIHRVRQVRFSTPP